MLRTLFSPRLLGLHLVVLGAITAFTLLGRWQLGVFEESGRPRVTADPAPVAVEELVKPGPAIGATGRLAVATGSYDAAKQLLVPDRRPDVEAAGGRAARGAGYWVLTPLRLADGSLLPILRSWTERADAVPPAPGGALRVEGRVRPPESSDSVQRTAGSLPAGQIATVTSSELINLWPGDQVRNGFLVADDSGVAVPPPRSGGEVTWRSLGYALNWWAFAGFAVFMWVHYVREAVQRTRGQQWSQPSRHSEYSPTSSA